MSFTINNKTFDSPEEFAKYGRGCATKIPNPVEILRVDQALRSNKLFRRAFKDLSIRVKFIHLMHGSLGNVNPDQRKKQIALLNEAYAPARISFEYDESEVIYINNRNWYYMHYGSLEEREAKKHLSDDPRTTLNFYTGGIEKGLLGWATFPFDLAGDAERDGVVVLDESMPDGSAIPFNLGMTAVHEVGHWLGLYHTFQGGCDGIGDHVHDTPAHSDANIATPEDGQPHNACVVGEYAPIHNYMNYVDDVWMTEFTSKQMERVQEQLAMFRPELLNR